MKPDADPARRKELEPDDPSRDEHHDENRCNPLAEDEDEGGDEEE